MFYETISIFILKRALNPAWSGIIDEKCRKSLLSLSVFK